MFLTYRPIEFNSVDDLDDDVKKYFLAYQEGAMLDATCASLYSAICIECGVRFDGGTS